MKESITVKRSVIELINELSKEKFPQQHICKLLAIDNVINEISIFLNLEGNRPEVWPLDLTLISALSYGRYLDKFSVSPDFVFEPEFIGFALSHPDGSPSPKEEDRKLFSYKGDVHIITSSPFNEHSWAAFDRGGNELEIEVID